jgi:hypothetical protein
MRDEVKKLMSDEIYVNWIYFLTFYKQIRKKELYEWGSSCFLKNFGGQIILTNQIVDPLN